MSKVKDRLVTPTGAARAWVSLLLALLAVAVSQVFMVAYVTKQSRKICGVIVLIDDRNRTLPPATDPDTARFRYLLHQYRNDLGC